MEKSLDFDDVLLEPVPSMVNSRDDVDISVWLSDFLTLKIPIIASPMKGIISPELIIRLSKLGGIGILHRFYEDEKLWRNDLSWLNFEIGTRFGVAVGIDEMENVVTALGAGCSILCVDVANGYIEKLLRYVDQVKELIVRDKYSCLLMAGNVVTIKGLVNLRNAGVDLVRVGIGSGQLCTTRQTTGIGRGQLSALSECTGFVARVIADGGIRNSGDIVKALAFGADAVMIGSLLGKTYESSHNGIIYGMASRRLQEEYYHSVKSVEGIEKEMQKEMSIEQLISELTYGIKSACTYLNAPNLRKLRSVYRYEVSK